MTTKRYTVTWDGSVLEARIAEIAQAQVEADQLVALARVDGSAVAIRQAVAYKNAVDLAERDLRHYIKGLERRPHEFLAPPPRRFEIDGHTILEFGPAVPVKGSPGPSVTVRAWLDERESNVHVYALNVRLPEPPQRRM